MLYAVPVVLIIAGRFRGCRQEERRLIATIATAATVAFVPTVVAGVLISDTFVKGCAYALAVVAGAHWAMLLGGRPGRDDPPSGEDDGDDPAPPFDWDGFERDFWAEVKRRPRVPA